MSRLVGYANESKKQRQQADHTGKRSKLLAMTSNTFFLWTFAAEMNKIFFINTTYKLYVTKGLYH